MVPEGITAESFNDADNSVSTAEESDEELTNGNDKTDDGDEVDDGLSEEGDEIVKPSKKALFEALALLVRYSLP